MRTKLRSRLQASLVALGLLLTSVALAQDTPLSADQQQVVDTVKSVFAAATADDMSKFHSVTSPSFYLYDNGARFDGDAIMTLIKQQHAAGKVYEWNVTDPDVHVLGKTAWIAYVNRGSVTDATGRHPMEWLESAFLQKENGAWKIVFMHSDRAANKPAQSSTK